MLTGLGAAAIALLLAAGVALDLLLGETPRWHPLVGFGKLANAIERRLNRGSLRFPRGLLAWVLAVLPLTLLAWGAVWSAGETAGFALHALMLYFCIGLRSLRDHNLPIAGALARGDLPAARHLTSRIVSRDTANATPGDLAKASTESLLENGNDAVFGTLFWFAVAGGPGAVLFRLANTLDAMWGYRNARFLQFGCAAARIDDALNYLPARLTALSYVLLAPTLAGKRLAWRCWRTQAPAWSSPNAGPVMSSGAGALGLALGGAAVYDGETEQRPPLGSGSAAQGADIQRAWQLVARTTALWLAAAAAIAGGLHA
ncbi:cobalamin biosynthesis protein CobD [Massilia sp. Root418]|jgi:adenosylcobinamide-phosphate synthase|uniref:CobD/CbiB family cobalamin biosynthesis protein n=1 Tax=Massilia sp. Root418 TaxID=1736532 RepID=UPI0007011872|nr:CobD/CbiB family cobalamin biosynthesis protein [Massilia sp. Root418]KQW99174.1 cobalamin biosynthesis protein CobD [Massilia sp. Root418]